MKIFIYTSIKTDKAVVDMMNNAVHQLLSMINGMTID